MSSSHPPFLRPPSPFALRSRTRNAFTLVELLAVIAIVGVLAALLFAAYGGIMRAKNTSVCLANLRQIGTATLVYCADHKGDFPRAVSFPPNTVRSDSPWNTLLNVYLGLPSESAPSPIYKCPADPRDYMTVQNGTTRYARSYSFNGTPDLSASTVIGTMGLVQTTGVGNHQYPVRKLAHITAPSKTIMVTEWWTNKTGDLRENWQDSYTCSQITAGWTLLSNVPISHERSGYYHGANYNAVFVDGHVQSVTPEEIIRGWSEPGRATMWTAIR
ncbi:MAG: type II secretion system protein [Opitutaceae bacterium]|jgi:prepilin-type N-terminal cleavage/methylation domain-containing protein/prepilin-type processing-associated H-X9-DG protein